MEWLLLIAKPAETYEDCKPSSASMSDYQPDSAFGLNAEQDTKPVINNRTNPSMSYDDVKLPPTVNNKQFIGINAAVKQPVYCPKIGFGILETNKTSDFVGMFIGNPTGSKQTAYYSKKETLYHEYTSLYWGKDPSA